MLSLPRIDPSVRLFRVHEHRPHHLDVFLFLSLKFGPKYRRFSAYSFPHGDNLVSYIRNPGICFSDLVVNQQKRAIFHYCVTCGGEPSLPRLASTLLLPHRTNPAPFADPWAGRDGQPHDRSQGSPHEQEGLLVELPPEARSKGHALRPGSWRQGTVLFKARCVYTGRALPLYVRREALG